MIGTDQMTESLKFSTVTVRGLNQHKTVNRMKSWSWLCVYRLFMAEALMNSGVSPVFSLLRLCCVIECWNAHRARIPTNVLSHPDAHCWASWCRGQVSANRAVLWKCFTCSLCSPPCSSELRWQIWVTQVPMWHRSRRRRKAIPEFDLQEDFCDRKSSAFSWWRAVKLSTQVSAVWNPAMDRSCWSIPNVNSTLLINWTWGALQHEHLLNFSSLLLKMLVIQRHWHNIIFHLSFNRPSKMNLCSLSI